MRIKASVVPNMVSTRENNKIFKTIIKPISINMMNKFLFGKFSAKMLFHNIAVFKNPSVGRFDFVIKFINGKMFCPKSHILSGWRKFFSTTFNRTIYSFRRWTKTKFFKANWTNSNHYFSFA